MDMANKRVFVSYSHQDHTCAKGIARFLDRQGYDVWIDADRLMSGRKWAADINVAMDNADAMITILSENSIRRKEVLREIEVALDRVQNDKKDNPFKLLFVVVGNLHPSWFVGKDTLTLRIIRYLEEVQFIQLDAKANITIASMQNLLRALNGQMIYSAPLSFENSNNSYIYETGIPERVYDNTTENCFYRVHSSDLAPSTVFPFALDNQWLPDELIESDIYGAFLKDGFGSPKVQDYINNYQLTNLYLALIHSRQVIINRASVLNSRSIQRFYCAQEDNALSNEERRAFEQLLENGTIIIFLYGDNAITPHVNKKTEYSTEAKAVEAWNELCSKISVYCIRENWETPVDKHRMEFVKHCTTLAFSSETNEMLANCFGFDSVETKEFFTILKEIEMTVFLQTHIIGTGHRATVEGYSRSAFYKSFIVQEDKKRDTVLYCIFDTNKPFYRQLKKMIDVYYNSIFTNYFNCWALLPNSIKPEDTFIHQLYLNHGTKEVGVDELKYAFSEFFANDEIIQLIDEIGSSFYIDRWSLSKILEYRKDMRWLEYIELLESIVNRSTNWKVDFSEVEQLIKLFVTSIKEFERTANTETQKRKFIPAYTFRICIGSKVLDVVCSKNVKKLKQYPGTFFSKNQNRLTIQFQIGDTTTDSASDSIFFPIKIFDGKTNYLGGNMYFESVCNFLVERYNFVWLY